MPGDPIQILRREQTLRSDRSIVEFIWRDCYAYTFPARGTEFWTGASSGGGNTSGTLGLSTASVKQADLLDSTGTDAARILAAALMSGLTPANSRWFELDAGEVDDASKRWLEDAAEATWKNIHAGNYDCAGYEGMIDIVATGQCLLYADAAKEGGIYFEQWPLAQCVFTSSRRGGPVDIVYRRVALSAEQAVAEYGADRVSDRVRVQATKNPDTRVEFVHAIYPRGNEPGPFALTLPYASCHVEVATKKLVRESGYHELPVIVPRWLLTPSSAYAVGPAFDALPDLKTLNEVIKYQLAGMDIAVAGMWIAADDGVLNPRTVKVGPRKIIVAASTDSMKPLLSGADMNASLMEIERLQRSIRKVMMADQLQPQDKPQMTATEVNVRVELIRQLLGPIYGRMQSEYLQPLVHRCFGLALRAGALGAIPRGLVGRQYSVHFLSPIARSQRMVEVAAMDRYEAALFQQIAVQPDLMDNYDLDAATRERGENIGVPRKLFRDTGAVEALRKQRADQAQAAQANQSLSIAAQASDAGQSATALTHGVQAAQTAQQAA